MRIILVGIFALISSINGLTFYNPITDVPVTPFPEMTAFHLDSNYYLLGTTYYGRTLTIWKSGILTNFYDAESKDLYGPGGFIDACEMVMIDGELYLYFTEFTGIIVTAVYAMRAVNASNPMGDWYQPELVEGFDYERYFHYKGGVMRHDGRNYFVWGSSSKIGGEDDGDLAIHIAEMNNATSIKPKVVLRYPSEDWECDLEWDECMIRSPSFVYGGNASYLIFSANWPWRRNFSLAQMSIEFGKDPMEPNNWDVKGPVLGNNEEEAVFNPGFATFVDSPDGTETWMVYSAKKFYSNDMEDRTLRLERIDWDDEGQPIFPIAHGYRQGQTVPSGQTST